MFSVEHLNPRLKSLNQRKNMARFHEQAETNQVSPERAEQWFALMHATVNGTIDEDVALGLMQKPHTIGIKWAEVAKFVPEVKPDQRN